MNISEEATEAALAAFEACRGWPDERLEAALTAALPYLAPKATPSDEELARDIAASLPTYDANCQHSSYDFAQAAVSSIASALAAVRAEATLAEREACAKVADGFTLEANQGRNRFKVHESWRDDQSPSDVFNLGSDDAATYIAADIRERKP